MIGSLSPGSVPKDPHSCVADTAVSAAYIWDCFRGPLGANLCLLPRSSLEKVPVAPVHGSVTLTCPGSAEVTAGRYTEKLRTPFSMTHQQSKNDVYDCRGRLFKGAIFAS